ncbi:hypothetical protein KP509_11G082500 [Ceratopteris richardii]|uniref:BAG domain-containing protein n=1 Tax=Ceratopteris richardii TaxID=49495 RepID=A0A8T2TTA8_CERRI|nr:hypothetical protein KP509_11G082500 [Ceratopteris richardii]
MLWNVRLVRSHFYESLFRRSVVNECHCAIRIPRSDTLHSAMRRSPFYTYPSYTFPTSQSIFSPDDGYVHVFPHQQQQRRRPSFSVKSSQPNPSRSVITIPVSDSSPSSPAVPSPSNLCDSRKKPRPDPDSAATTIQACFRGFSIRRRRPLVHLRVISEVRNELQELVAQLQSPGFPQKVLLNEIQRLRYSESVMALILRLDAVEGSVPEVRNQRKEATKMAIELQDAIDLIMAKQDLSCLGSKLPETVPSTQDSGTTAALQDAGTCLQDANRPSTSQATCIATALVEKDHRSQDSNGSLYTSCGQALCEVHDAITQTGSHDDGLAWLGEDRNEHPEMEDELMEAIEGANGCTEHLDHRERKGSVQEGPLVEEIQAVIDDGVFEAVSNNSSTSNSSTVAQEAGLRVNQCSTCAMYADGLPSDIDVTLQNNFKDIGGTIEDHVSMADAEQGSSNVCNENVTGSVPINRMASNASPAERDLEIGKLMNGAEHGTPTVCEEDTIGLSINERMNASSPAEQELDGEKSTMEISACIIESDNPEDDVAGWNAEGATAHGYHERKTSADNNIVDCSCPHGLDQVTIDGGLSSSDSLRLKKLSDDCGELKSLVGKLIMQNALQSNVISALNERLEMLEEMQQRFVGQGSLRGKRKWKKKGVSRIVRGRKC